VFAAAALLLLNASLTFGNVWPTPKIRWENALSVELAVCVLLLAVAHQRAERLARRLLPVLWVLLVAGHYLDVTAPGLYGRDFNLYWDSRHLGNVTAMLARAVPAWQIVAAAAGLVTVIAAVSLLSRLALRHLAAAVQHRRARLVLGSAAALVIAAFALQQFTAFVPAQPAFADPATGAYLRQARYVVAMAATGGASPVLGDSPDFGAAELRGLDGADVVLVFLESYGAVTFDNPAFADTLAATRRNLEAAARDAGRELLSAYVESPTFGASSWLAHLSLLTGVKVTDQYEYTSLMASSRDTIVKAFGRGGYRTVALMPGMRQPWPEGAFYGFDEIYGRDLLAYQGPEFGWWGIPDQFALARLDALARTAAPRPPLFAVFPTSTSHAPFGPVPPFLPEWSRALQADGYRPEDVARAAAPNLTDLAPSYLSAIAYGYDTLAGYLRAHAGENLVVIVIGDHQPPAAVSGRTAVRDVPVHVIASQPGLLSRLRESGFHDGLAPGRPGAGEMHALAPRLWEAFNAGR
jgi:hypothetical protein